MLIFSLILSKVVEMEGGTLCMMNQISEEISKTVIEFLNDKDDYKH